MDVHELTQSEQNVLVGVVRHLVMIDEELSDSELYDLIRLGYRIGRDEFKEALRVTEALHSDAGQVLEFARSVTRLEAQVRIEAELTRIAAGDGIHDGEADFITRLLMNWRG